MPKTRYTISPFKKLTAKQVEKRQNTEVEMDNYPYDFKNNTRYPKQYRDDLDIVSNYNEMLLIYKDIIYLTGLAVNNNIVIDADTNLPLMLHNDKFLCLPFNTFALPDTFINFDPLFNSRIMEIVFNTYIRKYMYENQDVTIRSYFIYMDRKNTKEGTVKGENGRNLFVSHHYLNDCPCYLELIYQMECRLDDEELGKLSRLDKFITSYRNLGFGRNS